MPFAFCTLPFDLPSLLFAFRICLLPTAYCLLTLLRRAVLRAQSPPYAAINHDAVSYNGPGAMPGTIWRARKSVWACSLPLAGPRQAEGEALRRAAQMAIDEENATSLPGGRRLRSGHPRRERPLGPSLRANCAHGIRRSSRGAHHFSRRGSAHLAEQVGNKIGVPILTLSTDSTTTEINLPWIFRLGPTDAVQAQAFARDIYQKRKLQRVVLLTQNDRDGRLGGEEFIKAAGEMNAAAPSDKSWWIPGNSRKRAAKELATAQAVVIWTDAATASRLRRACANCGPPCRFTCAAKRRKAISAAKTARPAPRVAAGCQPWIAAAPRKPASSSGLLPTLSPALRHGARPRRRRSV